MNDGSRRTKIVATLGPASSTPELVTRLATAGVDAFRLNLSHGTHADHADRVRAVRAVQAELQKPLAIIADLQGPKIRVGDLPEPRTLVAGQIVEVVGGQEAHD